MSLPNHSVVSANPAIGTFTIVPLSLVTFVSERFTKAISPSIGNCVLGTAFAAILGKVLLHLLRQRHGSFTNAFFCVLTFHSSAIITMISLR